MQTLQLFQQASHKNKKNLLPLQNNSAPSHLSKVLKQFPHKILL
uniref:Uncharacterized protein n=1 Tax=Lotus japonicus TaxID=34305 RepID=I3SX95_LOTJA|nr:unknown [Lotus japonicus]